MVLNKHDEHCKEIAETLEKYISGDFFLWDGELYSYEDFEENEEGDNVQVIDGEEVKEREVETASLYDFFDDDIFDIDYILDRNKELKAVRVMIACGGPNIYINTYDMQVELFWWSESGKYRLFSDTCDAINDFFSEYFEI